jgi:hypothetical protein
MTPRKGNFRCPYTDKPCVERGCKLGVVCVVEERDRAEARVAEEKARQRRIRAGRILPEDFFGPGFKRG